MSRFHVFGAFWTRFGSLGIRAKLFCERRLRRWMRIWVTSTWRFESPETDVGRNGKSHPTWGLSESPTWGSGRMSGTEYGFSLWNHPPERFSIRPSGLKIPVALPPVLISAISSISAVVLYGFWPNSHQLRILWVFLWFLHFLSLGTWVPCFPSPLPPKSLTLGSNSRCRRREKWRVRRGDRFDARFELWLGVLSSLTEVDWRIDLPGVRICEVECLYVLSRWFQYFFLHFPFSVDLLSYIFCIKYWLVFCENGIDGNSL